MSAIQLHVKLGEKTEWTVPTPEQFTVLQRQIRENEDKLVKKYFMPAIIKELAARESSGGKISVDLDLVNLPFISGFFLKGRRLKEYRHSVVRILKSAGYTVSCKYGSVIYIDTPTEPIDV